jgi:hypothetical protein
MADTTRPHGAGVRGLTLDRRSRIFNGPFGRIFRALPPADFGMDDRASERALTALGTKMVADPDPVKDGPDAEESGIPAAYTYFGQFIDHDLTFDPTSSLQRQNDPDALVDFRTPRFDLDSVYGRGPGDQPYLYADGLRFLHGEALTGSALGHALAAKDLPRSRPEAAHPNGQARAIIGDPRNDENVIVSQLHGLMLRFHDKLASDHPGWSFAQVQQEVRFHYQWVVLNDFLPTVVSKDVLDKVLPHLAQDSNPHEHKPQLEFYEPRDKPFMPLEFSAAAYRFGHSMVRPGYRLNDKTGPFPIFLPNDANGDTLAGFRRFPRTWAIDWARFLDLEPRPFGDEDHPANPGNRERTQLAYRIDTSLVNPLGSLPLPQVVNDPPENLATRNLLRGWRMRLPTGQDVARAMGVTPLPDSEILIGKFTGNDRDIRGNIVQVVRKAFKGNCPLWTYVLAETEKVLTTVKTTDGDKPIMTCRLGPVGGRIVAETIVGLLVYDSSSFLNLDPRWKPSLAENGVFGLKQLVAAALQG